MANFTGQPISSSYQRVLQIDGGVIQDGLGSTISNATIGSLTGSFSGSLAGTSSWAQNALTASYIPATAEDLGSSLGVNVATITVLSGTPLYNNGASGVGATLSASVAGILAVDGITTGLGDRILVKNQVSSLQNGVYEVTTAGATGVRYILTRTTDSDETDEFDPQVVIPSGGNTNRGKIYGQTVNLPVIGTSPISYIEINTNQFVSQVVAGTQTAYNIPWWTSSTRQLSRGVNKFQFNSATDQLKLTGSLVISGSITGSNNVVNPLTASYAMTASGIPGSSQYIPYWSGTSPSASNTLSNSSIFQDSNGNILIGATGTVGSKLYLVNNSAGYGGIQVVSSANTGGSLTITHLGTNSKFITLTNSASSEVFSVDTLGRTVLTGSLEINTPSLGTTFKTTPSGSIVLSVTSSNTPGYTGQQGEMFFGTDGSGNYVIWAYLGGAWRSGSLV